MPVDVTKAAKQLWFKCKRDRRYFFRQFLRIRTLEGGQYVLAPLILNREQDDILLTIERQEAEGKPVRIIVDK